MKCPLLLIGAPLARIKREPDPVSCLKEDCAWWDATELQCGVLTGCLGVEGIWANLQGIREKIPFTGQFTK